MNQHIGLIALVVDNYDDAIAFYVEKLNFILVEDTNQPEQDKRWVVVRPPGANVGTGLLLAEGKGDLQRSRIGDQTGGRVFLFLYTDDFARDFANLEAQEITIVRPPHNYPYGTVAVFADLYGNLWDLIEPTK